MKYRYIVLIMTLFVTLGCGLLGLSSESADTPSPAEVEATAAPLNTQAPTLTPTEEPTPTPDIVPGIDEPVDVVGGTFQLEDVIIEESLVSGDSIITPDEPGHVFLTLFASRAPVAQGWAVQHLSLICNDKEQSLESVGIKVEGGILAASLFSFSIPESTSIAECTVHIDEQVIIPLERFQ